jgi:Fic family protein
MQKIPMGPQGGTVTVGTGEAAYEAFVPAPLPPDIRFNPAPDLIEKIQKALSAVAALEAVLKRCDRIELYIDLLNVREAVCSCRMSGSALDFVDAYLAYETGGGADPTPGQVDFMNLKYARTSNFEDLRDNPFNADFLRDTHMSLIPSIAAVDTELRRRKGAGSAELRDADYVPPQPPELRRLISNLDAFMKEDGRDQWDALLRAALFHYQLVSLCPFKDANGRTARLMTEFFLKKNGVITLPVLPLSPYFERRKKEYFGCIRRVQEGAGWDEWLRFFVEAVTVSAEETLAIVDRGEALFETARKLVMLLGRTDEVMQKLLWYARLFPVFHHKTAAQRLREDVRAVRECLAKLEKYRTLNPCERGGDRFYVYSELVEIIAGNRMRLRSATRRDMDFFERLSGIKAEWDGIELVRKAADNGVNFNAIVCGEETESQIAEAADRMAPWVSVIRAMVRSGFDPLLAPEVPKGASAAVQMIDALETCIEEDAKDADGCGPTGRDYTEEQAQKFDSDDECSVLALTKYLLDFKPDLTALSDVEFGTVAAHYAGFSERMLEDGCFFACAASETVHRILRYAECGRDYHRVYSLSRVFGRTFKGVSLYADPADGGALQPSFEEKDRIIRITGRAAFRFDGFDLVLSDLGMPVADNTVLGPVALMLPADGLLAKYEGKVLEDIMVHRIPADKRGRKTKHYEISLFFENFSVLLLKVNPRTHLIETIERDPLTD